MHLYEIHRKTGRDYEQIAADLGIDGEPGTQGFHIRQVDDAIAQQYIDEAVKEHDADHHNADIEGGSDQIAPIPPKRVWFWSAKRHHILAGDESQGRERVEFRDWLYETTEGSDTDKWLSSPDVRDRLGIRKIIDKPYESTIERMRFMQMLRAIIYTGRLTDNDPGPLWSREGMACVRALLRPAEINHLTTTERNVPERLLDEVVKRKSFNVKIVGVEV